MSGDFLLFVQSCCGVRRDHPGLRGDAVIVFHVHDGNRVIAFHRGVDGAGNGVVVVASLAETARTGYRIGMPRSGRWARVFNSNVYDTWVNPHVTGNGGSACADGTGMHGTPASASITIPPIPSWCSYRQERRSTCDRLKPERVQTAPTGQAEKLHSLTQHSLPLSATHGHP